MFKNIKLKEMHKMNLSLQTRYRMVHDRTNNESIN